METDKFYLDRNDLAFIHDALLSHPFQGGAMLHAASLVRRLGRVLDATSPAPAAAPEPSEAVLEPAAIGG